MKHILLLSIVLLALAACAPRLDTPGQLGEALFAAYRAGDADDWLRCCLEAKDIAWLDTRVRLSSDDNPADYAPLSDLTDELPVQYGETFAAIRNDSAAFDWTTAVLSGVEVGDEVEESWVPPGVRLIDSLTLNIQSGDTLLSLRFYDIVKTERGWLVSNPIHRLQREKL